MTGAFSFIRSNRGLCVVWPWKALLTLIRNEWGHCLGPPLLLKINSTINLPATRRKRSCVWLQLPLPACMPTHSCVCGISRSKEITWVAQRLDFTLGLDPSFHKKRKGLDTVQNWNNGFEIINQSSVRVGREGVTSQPHLSQDFQNEGKLLQSV